MRKFWAVVVGIVNELTDQTAYKRYLEAHALNHSADSWRAFSDERHGAKYKRAKCC